MMEATSTSETLVNFYQTTRRYNPENSRLPFNLPCSLLFFFVFFCPPFIVSFTSSFLLIFLPFFHSLFLSLNVPAFLLRIQ
jgi:hypothetical protein